MEAVVSGHALTSFRKLMLVMRISYTLPFVMASLSGVAYGLFIGGNAWLALLIPMDVFVLAMFVNFSNDYFDHLSGVDEIRFRKDEEKMKEIDEVVNRSFYWDGNSLDNGIITEAHGKLIMIILVAGAVTVSLPIVYIGGWIVIALGLVALGLAFLYTAPPVNLGAHGLGEIDVLVSFTMIAFFAYFVMVPIFSWEMLLFATITGIGAMNMRIIDQVSGYEAHLAVKERNLCYHLGPDQTAKVVRGVIAVTGMMTVAMIWFNAYNALLLLALLPGLKAWRDLGMRDIKLWYMRPVPKVLGIVIMLQVLFILSLTLRTVLPY